MKKYTEIMDELKAVRAESADLEKRMKEINWRDERYAVMATRRELLAVEVKILRDNARRAFVAEALPLVLGVIAKYEGKPYGEKTREKIAAECKEKAGCWAYVKECHGGEISLTTPGYEFGYNDFVFYAEYDQQNGGRPHYLVDNKIQHIDGEKIRLSNCAEYVDDAEAHAQKIMDEFAKLKAQYETMESACKQFNELLPSGVEHRHTRDFRNYLM